MNEYFIKRKEDHNYEYLFLPAENGRMETPAMQSAPPLSFHSRHSLPPTLIGILSPRQPNGQVEAYFDLNHTFPLPQLDHINIKAVGNVHIVPKRTITRPLCCPSSLTMRLFPLITAFNKSTKYAALSLRLACVSMSLKRPLQ